MKKLVPRPLTQQCYTHHPSYAIPDAAEHEPPGRAVHRRLERQRRSGGPRRNGGGPSVLTTRLVSSSAPVLGSYGPSYPQWCGGRARSACDGVRPPRPPLRRSAGPPIAVRARLGKARSAWPPVPASRCAGPSGWEPAATPGDSGREGEPDRAASSRSRAATAIGLRLIGHEPSPFRLTVAHLR